MALICVYGTRECTGCGSCSSRFCCDVCKREIKYGENYYEAPGGRIICKYCAVQDACFGLPKKRFGYSHC